MDSFVLRADQDRVAVLTLNQPSKLNALSTEMLEALGVQLDAIANDPAIRVVLIRAVGKAFCAGHDLREIQAARGAPDGGAAAFTTLFTLCATLMQKIAALPQPVVAEVQGIATAAGCQLAATCDMVVASASARFGVNGVNIGLFCTTPLVALARKIPPAAAFDLAATGGFLTASQALSAGLVTRVATPETLQAEAFDVAQNLAQKLPSALALGKKAFAHQFTPLAEAYAKATPAMIANLLNADTAEGIAAFLEKRPPNWG